MVFFHLQYYALIQFSNNNCKESGTTFASSFQIRELQKKYYFQIAFLKDSYRFLQTLILLQQIPILYLFVLKRIDILLIMRW